MANRLGLEYMYDERAERAVISTVALDPGRLAEVQPMLPSPSAFFLQQHQLIYEAQLDLDAQGIPLDAVTIAKRLQEMNRWAQVGAPFLADVIDATPAIANVEAHARIVRDKWRLRTALSKAQEVTGKIKGGEAQSTEEIQLLLESTEVAFSELAHLQHARGLRDVQDVLGDACDELVVAKNAGTMSGTDTGYSRLNAKLSGLHDGDLMIVAGRPGSGKTGFAMNLATRVAAKGAGVAIFSLEMTDVQLAYRMIGAHAKINVSLFRRPQAMQPAEWHQMTDAVSDLSKTPIWIDDTPAITVPEIRSRVRKLKQQIARSPGACTSGLRVVVVDYMQLCTVRRDARSHPNRQEIVAEVSQQLKNLAKQERLCVVALSQLNRAVEVHKRPPQLSDLRESGAIEQDADAVLFVHRPDMHLAEPDPVLAGTAELLIAKQRHGATGMIRLKFTKEYVRFDPLEDREFDEYDSFDDDDWFEKG